MIGMRAAKVLPGRSLRQALEKLFACVSEPLENSYNYEKRRRAVLRMRTSYRGRRPRERATDGAFAFLERLAVVIFYLGTDLAFSS
jgi:hypothetical protein